MRVLFCSEIQLGNTYAQPVSYQQPAKTLVDDTNTWETGLGKRIIGNIKNDAIDSTKKWDNASFTAFLKVSYTDLTDEKIKEIVDHFFPATPAKPGEEFSRAATAENAQGTRETENTNIDRQIKDFCSKYTDADLERLGNLGFSRDTVRNNFERWVRAAIGNPPDKDKLAVLDYNFNFFLSSDEATTKMVSSLMHMINYDTGNADEIILADKLTEAITNIKLNPEKMTDIIKADFLSDLLSASLRHKAVGEDFREALSLAINSKNSPMFDLANYIYGLINDGTIDVDMGQKILKAKSGKASPEEREQIYRELEAKYGKEMADRIMDDIQKELQRQYDNLSEEERAEHADEWEAIHDTAKQDQEIFKKLGWTKSLQSAENLVASISPMLAARASAPGLNPDAASLTTSGSSVGVLSSNSPPPASDTLTAAIDSLRKAASAEEFKAELASVRAELHKLDEQIEENNKNASKLFTQELDKTAQEKLENELAEQKVAVQVLLEVVAVAENIYSAEIPDAENTSALQQTLETLAELAQWIAPRLETEIKSATELLQRSSASADRAAKAGTEDLRDFYKQQIVSQINKQVENKYQVNLELRQNEMHARLFDIFVDLAFAPIVSEKFLPDLQAISTFIQKARTLAETIRLDRKIATNTRAAVEEFCLQLEKISALPGLQIVMGWKTKLEVQEAEQKVKNEEISPLKADRELSEARKKLTAHNLPGMLTVWENLDEPEKQYQENQIRKELQTLSLNDLVAILGFGGEDLPLELRAVVKTEVENKLKESEQSGALKELPLEKLKALLGVLAGAGLSELCGIVQNAIDEKIEKETEPNQSELVTA